MSKIISIRLSEDLLKEIDDLAEAVEYTRSDIVRIALEFLLANVKKFGGSNLKDAFFEIINETKDSSKSKATLEKIKR